MLDAEKHIALLCNPTAQKALRLGDLIAVELRQRNIRHSIFTAYWPQLWSGITEAWIIGGDGTMNFFANTCPDFQLPIALFAGGTGNDLHHLLYGKISPAQQIDRVLQSEIKWIDAGICNGKLFLNGVGIGFDGAVVKTLLSGKTFSGKAAYLHAILKNIFHYRSQPVSIHCNDALLETKNFMISIANGRSYGGGFQVAPKASVTDGLLDVMSVENVSLLQRLRYLPVIEKGKHLHLPFINYQQTESVRITSGQLLSAHRDGEYFSADVFEIAVLKKRFAFRY